MINNRLCRIIPGVSRLLFISVVLIALVLCIVTLLVTHAQAQSTEEAYSISLSDNEIIADYPGVYSEGGILTITLPGEYSLTGQLSNGQIVVDCEQTGKVKLYFNGISVHCEDAPALYIKKCSPRLSIELVGDTVNELSDGAVYVDQQSNADGVIFSKSDLTITGEGTLNVNGTYRDGIVSKDDLRFKGGKITVNAVHNGICGKDCVEIFDGEIHVNADNDGIKTTNDDPEWGYILIEGGTVSITCGDEPLTVVHGLSVTGGIINAQVNPSLKESE